jgi:DNA-binding NarL/FixJ family response regulator
MRTREDRTTKPGGQTAHEALGVEIREGFGRAYRVLIADDHAVVRRGIRALLESQPGIEVCCEASTGVQAIEHIKAGKPDLVLLDLTMPETNGLEVLQVSKQDSPSTEILILSMHFSEELAREVLRAGAIGYVLKSDADSELLAAVDHARHHQLFFTGQLAASMAHTFVEGGGVVDGGADTGEPRLTNREVEVVHLLASGMSNKEVAAELKISTRTIESHRNRIMKRMSFQSFSDLVRFAVRENLVEG